jgi:hypothetical protein
MALKKFSRMALAFTAVLVVTALAVPGFVSTSAFAAPKKTKMDTPTISCDDPTTQVAIKIKVCAPGGTGATGAPAGFSLQWETAADYALNGWRLSDDSLLCKGSFSGNANLSRYNLAAGECVTVKVGDFLIDEGASTNCPNNLECGTDYVFRAFAHASSTLNRSDFTANLACSTQPCGQGEGEDCTFTQGYWRTHTPLVCDTNPESPLCIAWPVDNLTLGTVNYTASELVSIFNKPAAGNGLLALAHQLIAAKLNIANGADGTDASAAIAAADSLIGGLVVPPVGSGFLSPSTTSALTDTLATYNEGGTGPGHCQ